MKKIYKVIFLLAITLTSQSKLFAQQVLIDAELRPRFELRNGYKQLSDSSKTAYYGVSQRSKLNLKYQSNNLSAKISFHDVRTWGEEQLKTDVAGIALYEAWAEIKIVDSLTLKAGRQELIYDNQRLLSNNNWSQKAVTHDAALFKFKRNSFSVDMAAAFNQSADDINFGTDYKVAKNYKTFNFIWLTKKFGGLSVSAVGIADGYQKRKTTNTLYLRQTYGPVVTYNKNDFSAATRVFYQTGRDTAGSAINAYYANLDISYTFFKKLNILAGTEYISGNDATDTDNKQVNCFSTLCGSGHTFNGGIDYFTDMPLHTRCAGLVDGYLNISYKFTDKISVRADYHSFMLQNKYVSKGEVINKNLGSEIDLSCKINISKETSLQFGYSILFATKSMETIQNKGTDKDKIAQWGWVMLTIKPTFFKSEK